MHYVKTFVAAAAAAQLWGATVEAAPSQQVAYEPVAFKLRDGGVLQAERGTIMVPEDRGDPASRRIPLRFLRFKSTNPNPGAPIIYLAGGPGGSGEDTAHGPRQPVFLALRAVADVIALDQRGVGRSNSVPPCKAEAPFDRSQTFSEASYAAYFRQTLGACLDQWRNAGVAIEGYTTEESADDIEAVRVALGARKVNLWGISYGTHLALATMRRHPHSIERAALASIEGMDQTVKLPAHLDRALERVAAAAGEPGLIDTMRRVHARLDAEPQTVEVSLPDGSKTTFRMDSFGFRMAAGFLPKNPSGIKDLVQLYRGLDAGQYGRIAPLIFSYFLAQPLTLSGMPEAMDIASGVTPERLALIEVQAPASLLGRATNFPMPQLNRAVPGLDLGDAFRREVSSAIPVLVLSGDLDVRTPLEEQAVAIAGLRNRTQIIVRNGGHDLFEAHPAMPDLLTAFFSGKPLPVTELTLPPPAR